MDIGLIKEKLINTNIYMVLPAALKDMPLQFSEMEKEDGSYLTFRELEEMFDVLTLTQQWDERFFFTRYGMDIDTLAMVTGLLEGMNFKNLRPKIDGAYQLVKDIDFDGLVGNEFLFFPNYMAVQLPTTLPQPIESKEVM